MKYAVTVVSPPGYIHSAAFHEVAETIHDGLQSLGHDSVLTTEGMLPGRRHIVLGSNLLPIYRLPIAPDSILYNLEQIYLGYEWVSHELLDLFKNYVVWDYSTRNVNALAELGIKVQQVVPVGYAKRLTRIQRSPVPDIDVLFFGSVNPRRQAIMDRLRSAGLKAVGMFGKYGESRDQLIGRSKLLLNMHFYDVKILELVRISYYLANRCAVLSERSADPNEDAVFENGVAFADYEDLVKRACELCGNASELQRLASSGFEIMSRRNIEDYLRPALEAS